MFRNTYKDGNDKGNTSIACITFAGALSNLTTSVNFPERIKPVTQE